MKPRKTVVFLLPLVLAAAWFVGSPGDGYAQGAKMTVGQTGINPGTSLYFIAEKENLFTKHGLNVNIVKTNTAAAVQAMLGGTMQMSTGSGAAAFVTATLEGAPPFVLVDSWVNVFPYKVMALKEVTKVEDLRGKTGHVGAPFGTIPDTALRFAMTKLKLEPDKDVKLVQNATADPASILAAMDRGDVQFGILAPPFDRIAEKRGYRTLIALPDLGIPWQQNGEWVPRSYLSSNRDNVVRYVKAIADAMKIYFDQKEKAVTYLTEFIGGNREDVEYAYQAFAKWTDRNPRPRADTIRTTLDAIKKNTPKAASADPASFIDTSIVDQLVKEGYYK
ncbi:MAG TPA: ABC transporter substrate-binding protein [Candidatus Binatia bacterium]|nr:ABC transporter substrate-binding protein [Candidatus Binatia bacterium]